MRKTGFVRFLNLFLAYALLWPISAGDKMVFLSAPSDSGSAVSSPWMLYRTLGHELFGTQFAGSAEDGAAFRVHRDSSPNGLLVFQKPDSAPRDLACGPARRIENPDLGNPIPAAWAAPAPPTPVVPFHLNSKK